MTTRPPNPDATIHGNFDACPHCRADVDNLHAMYDFAESVRGRTPLEQVNTINCPHCGEEVALVTELTHSLARFEDTKP